VVLLLIEKKDRKLSDFSEQLEDYKLRYFNVDDITIVVPTLNEEQAIRHVLQDLQVNGYGNIMVVDGGSVDRTLEFAKKHQVKIVNQEGKKGKTGAIKTAIKHLETPYFALIDGDCTYAAEDVEKLLPYCNDFIQVIGARTKGRENISPLNRFGNWAINQLFNMIFGTNLNDVCSGMYLLSTDFAETLDFESEGFDVEVEISAHAANNGAIKEVPINYHTRVGTQKLHPFRDGALIISRILRMGIKLLPMRMLYLTAMTLFFPGLLLMGITWQLSLLNMQIKMSLLGLVLITLALQGLTLYIVDTRFKKS
jgi:dolichol-phosphate mannosyltransferase